MSYERRPDVDEIVDELASMLDSGLVQAQLATDARKFIAQNKINLLRLVLDSGSALTANEITTIKPRFEPSDLFLRLMAALRANSRDAFGIVTHDFVLECENSPIVPDSSDLDC
jgi:hypothetical protein